MTLCTFDNDKDSSGRSVFNGPCAANGSPLLAHDESKPMGEFSVIVRDDGKNPWAYKGKESPYIAESKTPYPKV